MTTFVKAIAWPVRTLVHGVNRIVPHNTRAGTVVVSVSVILTGSWLASVPQTLLPHFLWDAISWTIHGLGAAPLIDKVMKKDKKND